MNNTDLSIKKAQIARQVSEFMEDNPLGIDAKQLHCFKDDVTELMIECELSNTSDNIAKMVRTIAIAKEFTYT